MRVDVEPAAPEVAARRVAVAVADGGRGLVGQVERRGGGAAQAGRGDARARRARRTAGAALDHVDACGIVDLEVAGRR